MIEHRWTTINVGGEAWKVSRDALMVDGVRINPTFREAEEWARKLGAQLPPPRVLDARWREADLKNRFHCQKLWEGEDDGPLHSQLIDEDIEKSGAVPNIVGNAGKCWTEQRADGVCELYGIYGPKEEATTYRGTLMCWGLPMYEAESDETEDFIAQRSCDTDHNDEHHSYMTTGIFAIRVGGPDTDRCPTGSWHDGLDLQTTSLGLRCLTWLGYQFGLAPREIPGPEHEPLILSYSEHCRRGGRLLGVAPDGFPLWDGGAKLELQTDDSDSPWCAALASATLRCALLPGEVPPHSLRVSVRELVEDAREAGTLRPKEWTPTPGSLAILGRAGHDPLAGGPGHVRCVVGVESYRYLGLGGNEGDTIVCAHHSLTAPELRAWIER